MPFATAFIATAFIATCWALQRWRFGLTIFVHDRAGRVKAANALAATEGTAGAEAPLKAL